jgi:hypothetical protein
VCRIEPTVYIAGEEVYPAFVCKVHFQKRFNVFVCLFARRGWASGGGDVHDDPDQGQN